MSLRKRLMRNLAFSFVRSRRSWASGLGFLMALLVLPPLYGAPAPTATNTTLAISAPQVAPGTAVTLTATVTASAPVVGQVNFCDAAATYCTDIHLLGTVQITTSGTATLRFVPGIGSHRYKAVFTGTNSASASTSSESDVTVTGSYATTTAITSSGTAGNYTLAATVTGSAAALPTGTLSFVDTTEGSDTLGTGELGSGTTAFNLSEPTYFHSGDQSYSLVVGDFNGDGHVDVAVANMHGNTVTILLGNGDGTFTQNAQSLATGSVPDFIAVADFNRDGKADLAVVNGGGNTVSIFLGNGDGTFSAGAVLQTGSTPQNAYVSDFNGDGYVDLAVVNYSSNTVTILLGNGDGTFTPSANVPTGSGPSALAVGDYNQDGHVDLAIDNYNDSTLTIMLGNGDGTFTAAQNNPLPGANPNSIMAADLNADGKLDLAVANYGDNTVTVLLGNGDGTFSTAPVLTLGNNPYYIAIADYNLDGNPDLAVINQGDSTITTLLGHGDGTFTAAVTASHGYNPMEVVAADFNGDGLPDAAVAFDDNGEMTVFQTQLTQTVTATATNVSPAGTGTHLISASYPGDGNYGSSTSSTVALTAEPATTAIALSVPATATYGNPVTVNASVTDEATGAPATSGTVAFLAQGASFGSQSVQNGMASQSYLAPALGSFTISASFTSSNGNMNGSTAQAAIQITAAPLNILANNVTRTYGAANPQFAGTINGAVNGDSFAEAFTTPATTLSGVGSYPIVPSASGANLGNYSQNIQNGMLQVTAAALSVAANNASRTYGAANPAFTGEVSGASNGDTFTETFTTSATPQSPVGVYPIVPAVTGAALANYSTSPISGQLTVAPAPLAATAANATRVYGTPNPAFTGTLSGVVNGDAITAAFTTTAGTKDAPGAYPIIATVTGANLTDYAVAAAPGTLTVTQAGTTTTLTRPTNTAASDGSVELQVQVQSSTTGVPTGVVRFSNGTSLLGEATLENGAASFSTNQFQENTANQLTAVYQGDTNFLPSSSSALAVDPVTTDFSVAPTVGMQSLSVPSGGKVVFPLQVSPGNAGMYPGVVTFAVTAGLPAGATAVFSPATLAANSGAQTVNLTVQTAAGKAAAPVDAAQSGVGEKLGEAALALMLLPLTAARRLRRSRLVLLVLVVLGGIGGSGILTGCGFSATNTAATAPSTYNLTVTVTSGGIAHTTMESLTVQP